MRATIGLLTYNHQNSIHRDIFVRSLECLVNQDYKNKELVICDDHSTDGTYEICQKYAERYSFIKLFRNDQNLGAMMNFDKLLTNISGDIFLWACPDDCYAVNYVTACVNTFVKSNKTIMVTSAVKVLNDNGDIYHWYYHDFARNLPFRKLVRNILKCRDTMGFYIEYQSIIHASMVRVKYIPMIYCRDAFYGFEEAWFINTLIWGKLDYINSILYYRYASFVSYEIKNPEVFINFSKRFCYLVAALKYLKYFLFYSNIKFLKKPKYVHVGLLVFIYRIFPRIWAEIKMEILNMFQKLKIIFSTVIKNGS